MIDRVERDQIYMAHKITGEGDERFKCSFRIVHPIDHEIFQAHATSGGCLIRAERSFKLRKGLCTATRHEHIAYDLFSRMKRNGESILVRIVSQSLDS